MEQEHLTETESPQWWVARLKAELPEVTLPLSQPRSRIYSAKRVVSSFSLDELLAGRLNALQQRSGTAACDALLTAVAAVLHRYSGERLICVGSAAPLGTPLNAVPICVDLDPEQSLSSLMEQVADSSRAAHAHGDTPLADVIELLGLQTINNRNPLFSVAVRIEGLHGAVPEVRNDVTISARINKDDCSLDVDYSARLFLPETVERFAGHVMAFLSAILTTPQQALNDVRYLSQQELQLVLRSWNHTAVDRSQQQSVHQMVAAQTLRTPEAEAFFFAGRSYSYSWLDHRADQVLSYLRSRGCEAGDRIGLCMLPSPEMIVTLLAILKAGATVVPLDATLPLHRLTNIVQQVRPKLIVTQRILQEQFAHALGCLFWEDLRHELDNLPVTETPAPSKPDDPIYILFTSGSTGDPKGVVMRHGAIANLVSWQARQSGCSETRTLQRASIAFDVSFQEIFSTLCFGGSLVIATEAEREDVSKLSDLIRKAEVHRAFLPPVALYQLTEYAAHNSASLAPLEEVIVAGEQLRVTPAVIRLFRATQARLVNQYGPTETHVVTSYALTGPTMHWPKLPPIGRPINNARIYILDETRSPVPVGVAGEIYVAGLPLAAGYLDDAVSTGRAFFPDPFVKPSASRMYRTGDVARYLADGTIEFLGRRDQQVKIRGYRIELGEIEATLMQMPGVLGGAAVAREAPDGDRSLFLYVATAEPDAPPIARIRDFLKERLPAHMVPSPSSILRVASLPLTRTGKVDRRALPDPQATRDGIASEYAPTRTELERRIAAIWSRVLSIPEVGANDNFLELGGHSLAAIKIVSQLNEQYSVSVSLGEVLRGGTVAKLAVVVEQLVSGSVGPASELQPSSIPGVLADSFLKSVELGNGLRMACPYPPEAEYMYLDVFEHKTYDPGQIQYPPGACILDVGANIGLFALYALAKSPDARVFAFEPSPPLYTALSQNLHPYGERARFFDFALSDHDGVAQLTYYPTLTGMSSLRPDPDQDRALLSAILHNLNNDRRDGIKELLPYLDEYVDHRLSSVSFPCRVRPLSDVIQELGLQRIDLLKVDVQRTECEVLRGIAADDWRKIDQVVVESHDLNGDTDRIANLLREKGYQVSVEQNSIHRGSVVRFVYAGLRLP